MSHSLKDDYERNMFKVFPAGQEWGPEFKLSEHTQKAKAVSNTSTYNLVTVSRR